MTKPKQYRVVNGISVPKADGTETYYKAGTKLSAAQLGTALKWLLAGGDVEEVK